ncbi:MAG: hypothetical protein B7Y05_00565 [Polynucleobacter sp. 24-46-87]|nr:response regulator [Polynucleobacter sp. 35-46-11]OYY18101.1 MAG: hypothetical protein B7Y67_07160 [Polynucleobacter sp. 35-46-11]OZA16278.1 MAG: hypothetical protein B7Y05_00565 [Polynucleobacter sp. 24-46-87]
MNSSVKRKQIKIQLVDPHEITRLGVTHLLASNREIEICGTSSNGADALKLAAKYNPDLIIIEPDLHEESGIELISALLKTCKARSLYIPVSKILKFMTKRL